MERVIRLSTTRATTPSSQLPNKAFRDHSADCQTRSSQGWLVAALVLDSGGVSRLAERSQEAVALILALRDEGLWPPRVPSVVLVECLEGHAGRDAIENKFLKTCDIAEVVPEFLARRAALLRDSPAAAPQSTPWSWRSLSPAERCSLPILGTSRRLRPTRRASPSFGCNSTSAAGQQRLAADESLASLGLSPLKPGTLAGPALAGLEDLRDSSARQAEQTTCVTDAETCLRQGAGGTFGSLHCLLGLVLGASSCCQMARELSAGILVEVRSSR